MSNENELQISKEILRREIQQVALLKSILNQQRKQTDLLVDNQNLLKCQKGFLNVDELCLYTGLSKGWVYKLTSNRIIPHFKSPTGKMISFKRSQIDEWMMSRPVQTTKTLEQFEKELKIK